MFAPVSTDLQQLADVVTCGNKSQASLLKVQLETQEKLPGFDLEQAITQLLSSSSASGSSSNDMQPTVLCETAAAHDGCSDLLMRLLQSVSSLTPQQLEVSVEQLMLMVIQSGSKPDVHPALSQALQEWLLAIARRHRLKNEAGKWDCSTPDSLWFMCAYMTDHTYQHASSDRMAQLLLGPGAVPQQYVR